MNFFITRPIFAASIALMMVLAGGICLALLPVSQFPPMAPPQIQVTSNYCPHRGHMNFVSAQIDPTTDQMTARAAFPNGYERPSDVLPIPGQYAPVRVFVGKRAEALLIPKAALVESQAGRQVYVVGDGDKVWVRRVGMGGTHGDSWIVTKGLEKGEQVVVEGTQRVRGGIAVKLGKLSATSS